MLSLQPSNLGSMSGPVCEPLFPPQWLLDHLVMLPPSTMLPSLAATIPRSHCPAHLHLPRGRQDIYRCPLLVGAQEVGSRPVWVDS